MRMTMAAIVIVLLVLMTTTMACAEDGKFSVLWKSSGMNHPALTGSYQLQEWDSGWSIWGDAFWSPLDQTGGGGLSAGFPDDFPVVSNLMSMTGADRSGTALLYDFNEEDWGMMLYLTHDVGDWSF